jgi:O-antigen/teichoic acid export membrane protein
MVVNQLKAGAVLNYVVIGLNSLVGLLYTPYMLRMMGQSEYGLYSLVASVIAYLTIMDFGFGNAIIRYTAKFRAEGRQQEQYAMFGMFLILYSVIGVLAFGAGLGLYFNVEALFGDTMTVVEVERAKVLMIILIFNLAVTFPLSIFGAVVTAYEDFIFQKVVQIVRILLNTVVMICLLKMGYRAVAMVVVQTLFNLVTLLLNYYYCRRKIGIRIVFGRFRWGFLREVTVYSFWIFLNAIMDRIYWGTGQFVLGATVGTAAVAVFAVAIYLKDMYYSFSTSISGVFLPKVTAMITTGASEQTVSDLFIRIGRIQYIVLAYVLSAFILLGRPFIALWAGEGYDETYVIALMFFASTLIPMIQNLGITILQARNEMKYRSILILAVSAASLAAARQPDSSELSVWRR